MPLLGVTVWAVLAVLVDVSPARVAFGSVVPSLRIDLGIDFIGAGLVTSAGLVAALRIAVDRAEAEQRTTVSALAWSGGGLGLILRRLLRRGAAIAGTLIAARVRRAERAMGGLMALGGIGALLAIVGLPGGDLLFGFGLTAVPGLATAILRSRAGNSGATRAIALSVIAIGSGQFLGPLIAGAAAQHLGAVWAFGVAGAAYVGGVLLIVFDRLAMPRAAATV